MVSPQSVNLYICTLSNHHNISFAICFFIALNIIRRFPPSSPLLLHSPLAHPSAPPWNGLNEKGYCPTSLQMICDYFVLFVLLSKKRWGLSLLIPPEHFSRRDVSKFKQSSSVFLHSYICNILLSLFHERCLKWEIIALLPMLRASFFDSGIFLNETSYQKNAHTYDTVQDVVEKKVQLRPGFQNGSRLKIVFWAHFYGNMACNVISWNLWIGIYNGKMVTRQRLVRSWWFLRQTLMNFCFW